MNLNMIKSSLARAMHLKDFTKVIHYVREVTLLLTLADKSKLMLSGFL